MTQFKIGDRVKVKTTGKAGTITGVFPAEMWNLYGGDEYQIEFDSGGGALTVSERILESEHDVGCTCGLKFARSGGKHSSWCDFKEY